MTNKPVGMDAFSLDAQMQWACGEPPLSPEKPVIGITGNYVDGELRLSKAYYQAIVAAGGTPLVVPPVADRGVLQATLSRIDALLLSGGGDFNPLYEGAEPCPALHAINAERDLPELLAVGMAYHMQLPMLGICRGIQALATALGGSVEQDISLRATIKHSQDAERSLPTHTITIDDGTTLAQIMGAGRHAVNSMHHQAVATPGPRLRTAARAADGTIEAVESSEMKSIVGVQWHPEWLADGAPLFEWLVAQAQAHREAKRLHHSIVTLDSHCDSPMLFAKGANFLRRDAQLLTDLVKMHDGHLDATITAAYVPQPKQGEPFTAPDGIADTSAAAYANRVFSRVEELAKASGGRLAIARSAADVRANKLMGRKSVLLAIENGLALEGRPELVEHFANRGAIYITLCHNGDNDLCDSARGNATHGGVSALGERVIAEMNRCGVLVDLSHAAESTFYDALQMSAVPPVCSHSCARALCDHPRNLTDEQMRALAQRGGVMQVTLYHGFLRTSGQATILDAMAHLNHAIRLMGIEHVGIGTDFDGDGGVMGMASASEAMNFTKQLLARRYSPADIELIWGGNFLRAMDFKN